MPRSRGRPASTAGCTKRTTTPGQGEQSKEGQDDLVVSAVETARCHGRHSSPEIKWLISTSFLAEIMDITIFYAWQSDRDESLNRKFIRDAVSAACARINADQTNDWQITVDSDTQGQAGMCDIPNTILTKIRACDVFLADLTLVGTIDERPTKKIPNPNVVFELGYAARHLHFGRLIGVVNEAFGKIDGQIFDIKRRASVIYKAVATDSAQKRKKAAERLSTRVEEVIRITIEKEVIPRRQMSDATRADRNAVAQSKFADRVLSGGFHEFGKRPAVVTSVLFRVPRVFDFDKVYDEAQSLLSVNPEVTADTWYWQDDNGTMELSRNGYILRAYAGDYRSMQAEVNFKGGDPDAVQMLRAATVQRNIIIHVVNKCLLLKTLTFKPPWHIAISLVGIKGFCLIDDANMASPRKCDTDVLNLPLITVHTLAEVADVQAAGLLLRESLGYLCRSFGWQDNFCYTSTRQLSLRF